MDLPNILYVHSHDTGRYIQPYGWGRFTGNLQRLAEDGVVFRNAFSMAPTCTPSRASLLLGQSPHSVRCFGLAHRGFGVPADQIDKHIIHTLRKAGYKSYLSGVQHIVRNASEIGYDEIFITEGLADEFASKVCEFLKSRKAKSERWFISLGFNETHRSADRKFESSIHADIEINPNYLTVPHNLPDNSIIRSDFAEFYKSAYVMDKCVGMVLDALERSGLADNTLVIYTPDHGIAFPRMKCNLRDDGIGVALIMRGPGGFAGGKVIDSLISQVDIYPTICELIGIEPPDWLEGKSFLPIVRGELKEINEMIFAEINYHPAYEPIRAVRTKDWKYIRRFHDYPYPILCDCDDSPTKDYFIEKGWDKTILPREELYYLPLDPCESNNLVECNWAKGELERLREILHKWMVRTNDPLLNGDIPAPKDAIVSMREDRSSGDVKKRLSL